MLWKLAIEDAMMKTEKNIDRFGGLYPEVGNGSKYELKEKNDWTDGFWSGILWLCYEYKRDEVFAQAARKTVAHMANRLEKKIDLNHHDIGFLFSLSSKAQWIVEKDEDAKGLTLQAADHFMKRWRPNCGLIQAWGSEGDDANGGRIIIDCLMNLPLLYWAYEQTGDESYRNVAILQADKSRRYLIRGDDSSYHTFYFDQYNGKPLGGGTHQGYNDGSTWTRGQSWGVYGFALSYRYTKNPLYLQTAKRMARYFLERLPGDQVAYWDFDVPVDSETYRDSSASAITACGILELLIHLNVEDPDRAYLEAGMLRMMESLVVNYSTLNKPDAEGLLERGSYYVRGGLAPDEYVIWGDYYYLEALMRLEKRHSGFWYE